MNINDPKVRWAQEVADITGLDQAIIKNMFGSYDVKRASAVELINNQDLICVVEPKIRRMRNREELFDVVLVGV